jgi:hypothetical protein
MPCRRNLVMQYVAQWWDARMKAEFGPLASVSRSLSLPIAGTPPEATPCKIIEGTSRFVGTEDPPTILEVKGAANFQIRASEENQGISQDLLNETEAIIITIYDFHHVAGDIVPFTIRPDGDHVSSPSGAGPGTLEIPFVVRFARRITGEAV